MLLRLFLKDRDGERDQKRTNCSVGLTVMTTIVVVEPKVDARHASAAPCGYNYQKVSLVESQFFLIWVAKAIVEV